MPAHADTPEPSDTLTKPFWVSLVMHVAVLGSFAVGGTLSAHLTMGSKTGGGMGVLVNPVASIPLPNNGAPDNPVANDTKSQVPTPPAPKEKPKALPKTKAPPPDAIPLKSNKAPVKKQAEAQPQSQPNKFRDQQVDKPNQLYTAGGARANSQMYQMPGGGGVGLGDNSPFGDEFGTYANIIRNNIASKWTPMRVPGATSVVVTFTIKRDGSVSNVKIATSSGNQSLDFSAQRAVLDAQLPALPDRFPRSQADVQMKFELGN